jgi:DNA-binding response OmpR family regulator
MDLGRLVPTILITGRSWATTVDADELGLVAVLPKPFDLHTLMDIAAARVRRSESESGARNAVRSTMVGLV